MQPFGFNKNIYFVFKENQILNKNISFSFLKEKPEIPVPWPQDWDIAWNWLRRISTITGKQKISQVEEFYVISLEQFVNKWSEVKAICRKKEP